MTERRPSSAPAGRRAAAALVCLLAAAAPLRAQTPEPILPGFAPPETPTLNFYGSPGLIDMPTGEMLPDGQFTVGLSNFAGQSRLTATFQALPWLSASFRYNGIRDWNFGGFEAYYDRGFDMRFRLLQESRRWPALAVGFQDFVGTGIYGAEYIVATKSFDTPALSPGRLPGRLKLTAGMGWGRLGSHNSFGAPFGIERPAFVPNSTGGQIEAGQWFRGPAALFGGLEWRPDDRWGLKLEYSSDAYPTETGLTNVFERRSSLNFGVEYQAGERTRLGAYSLYGTGLGVSAQFQLSPYHPAMPLAAPAPLPVELRIPRVENPLAWSEAWAAHPDSAPNLRDALEGELGKQGIALEAVSFSGDRVELRYRNLRYRSEAIAIGRAARVLAQVLPPSVETFRLVPVSGGMGLSAVTLRRSDLEALEFAPDSSEALRAVTGTGEAGPTPRDAQPATGLYPNFAWGLGPYFEPSYFDPDQPVRMDVGLELSLAYEPAPGWVLAGALRHRLAGNVKDGRLSNSILPHVRTDQTLYAQAATTLKNLYAARQWRPGRNLYARTSAGYLESMYAGVAGELLWKPVSSRLALGAEAAYVRQRAYDQRLGLRDYSILTGHASAYLEMQRGYVAQLSAGRYLAGDLGATFSLDRTFANGWAVGGFFTLTDVPAEQFGEGSFDKGVRFSIPVTWFLGKPTRRSVGLGIRPIQRDGGQQLELPGRLYGQVRAAHARALGEQWARVWE